VGHRTPGVCAQLVTGRRADFTRLRQEDGLSGYPNRTESEHDWVENSHASTILSYATAWPAPSSSRTRTAGWWLWSAMAL